MSDDRPTLADITAGAADREHEPARPDDLDRLRARRDAEVLRAAADDMPNDRPAAKVFLRDRADRIESERSTLTEFLLARIAEDERTCGQFRRDAPQTRFEQRMWAEVKAKRQIVALHHVVNRTETITRPQCAKCRTMNPRWAENFWPCETLRILASVYSDHPDYDEAWRV